MKRNAIAILTATIWISGSEFVRNQIIFLSFWEDHYASKGLVFETMPINGAVWGVWSLLFAFILYKLLKKYTFKETLTLSWIIGFVLMWLVIGNLGFLPFSILWYAVPLSLIETAGAIYLINKFTRDSRK